ncbi:FAD-dependent oxidoreductase [Pusillimonas noertemannii]|uniref:FAD-dependent oxidoreductase n=1 Tax=Pusillimonas noertemannii TaxID=305977 RepID=UPI00333FA7E3
MAIAIVGSGPAGFYMADAVSKSLPNVRVHLFERLSLPFGLVRYGVAPDHVGTKAVYRLFDRVMKRPNVSFFGNVEIGRDVSLGQLESTYKVVVIATGGTVGRLLQFVGTESFYHISGLDFAGWFNGKPDALVAPPPSKARSVCILGNGNVGLDAARLLTKSSVQLQEAGVPEPVVHWRSVLGLEAIHIFGRRGAAQTKFGVSELEELGRSQSFRPVVCPQEVLDGQGENIAALDVLRKFSQDVPDDRLPITFHFDTEILGGGDGCLKTNSPHSGLQSHEAGMLIHAIGQRASPLPGLPFDEGAGFIPNENGLIQGKENVYAIGWAAKAGGGQIASNRTHAQAILPRLAAHLSGSSTPANGFVNTPPPWLPFTAVTWEQACAMDPWRT